ncbi:MAG TPA: hypothetical protein VGM98_06125 [Schlesneria sp.]
MRTVAILTLMVVSYGLEASGQSGAPARDPAELLQLTEADRTHEIGLQITIDDLSYDDYWAKTIDSIFSFADGNSDGVLNEEEIKLVPSARAVRLVLGSGFTPPVAAIRSLTDVAAGASQGRSKGDLQKYYRHHGAGRVTVGHGKLPNTAAITATILQALDLDQDGKLSQGELQKSEVALRRLDANEDELIGVGELVPNGTYPGSWAATALAPNASVNFSGPDGINLTLKRCPLNPGVGAAQTTPDLVSSNRVNWRLTVSDQIRDLPLKLLTKAQCESWSIRGPLSVQFDEFSEAVMQSSAEPSSEAAEGTARTRGRRPSRAWLTPLADRDGNGEASQQEIKQWLELQQQLVHGQVFISVYHGGGLFELLDANHDAGLSIRELRNAWQILEAKSCISDNLVDVQKIPNVLLIIASQGYPSTLASPSNVSDIEWFRQMDRNSDGDVSRREFTGTADAFNRIDRDKDGLISSREAETPN